MTNKENYFPKEELLDAYYPSELILVRENGKYRFAVHYYPGIPAIKVLHNDKDYLNMNVDFADFFLTDPDRKSPRSKNRTDTFRSHFVGDLAYCTPDSKNSKSDLKNLNYIIAPICKAMMSHQTETPHKSSKISLSLIMEYEKRLNASLFKDKEEQK